MSATTEQPAPAAQSADQPAAAIPPAITPDQAIKKCMTAYQHGYNASIAKGQLICEARREGAHSFRLAMPSLGSLAEIQAFIACIVHGTHFEVWICNQARDLFYAAQVAISAYKCSPPKKPEAEK